MFHHDARAVYDKAPCANFPTIMLLYYLVAAWPDVQYPPVL